VKVLYCAFDHVLFPYQRLLLNLTNGDDKWRRPCNAILGILQSPTTSICCVNATNLKHWIFQHSIPTYICHDYHINYLVNSQTKCLLSAIIFSIVATQHHEEYNIPLTNPINHTTPCRSVGFWYEFISSQLIFKAGVHIVDLGCLFLIENVTGASLTGILGKHGVI
jgi:hypothetical protein